VAGSNIDDVLVTAWQEFASYEETFTEDIFDSEYLYEGAWSKYSSHEEGRNDRVADITDLAGLLEGDGYDDESGATSCWLMDKGLTRGENDNLNELTMHLGLMEVERLNLSFATRAFGGDITPDPMPSSFEGHDDSDGVAISNDGINWHRLWQYEDSLSNWEYKEELNITEIWPEGEFDELEDIYIKFQQFGDGTVGDPLNQDGILWDALYLFSPLGGRFLFQAPQVKVDWEITSDDIYATDQGDENDPDDESATVTVDILGYGDTSVLESDIVGTDFKVRFTKNDDAGLTLDNIVADDFDDYESNGNVHTWTIDEVETEQEFTITFDVSKSGPFFDNLGTLEYRYEQWDYIDEDTDIVDWTPLDEIPVTIRSVMDSMDSVELVIDDHIGGERIISNKPDGSELTIISYDQFGEEMPAQTFEWDWVTTPSEGIAEVVPNLAEENKADIFAEPLTIGKTVEIIVDHDPMGYQYAFPAETITWGPPSKPEATLNEPYIVGERGVIGITLADDYGNRVPVWEGPMYVDVDDGAEVIWDDVLETDNDPGSPYFEKEYYYFGAKDKGGHDFIFTPMTWNDNGQAPTRISFWTPGMDPLTITIYPVAGAVQHLWPKQDTANMDSDDYFAGDEFYLTVQGLDKLFYPSESSDAQILVTHDSFAAGELEPEPWKSEGDVYLDMVDGFATNWNDDEMLRMPFIFYKAETVELTFRVRTNLGINNSEYKFPILVNPTTVKYLESTPEGSVDEPVTVMTSEEQDFVMYAYDEYGNEIPGVLRDLDWDVDSGIDPVDGMWDMNSQENRNTFKGIEYFAPEDFEGLIGEVADGYLRDDDGNILYSYKDGMIHATVTGPIEPPIGGPCPREGTEVLDIPIRVLNDYDVWLDEDEVWPSQVLANEQLELTANIHYKIPADELVGDLLEIKIKFSLVELDENGQEKSVLFDLHQENIRLLNLYLEPEGIYPFHHTVPAEFFRDYVDYVKKGMKDGDKKPNYIKVEIEDVAGGSDMKIFEKSLENDIVIVELFVVVPTPAKSPSFAPSIALVGIALLGLAVGSTFFSRRKKKGRGKDDDAVSPVIAIILMVAITIVLAGVLWLWVSGLVATGKEETLYKGFQSEWIEKTDNKDYQLLIKAVDGKNELSVEDLRFTLYALDKSDQTGGQHKVTNVYGKPISDQTFISFHDGDHDGMLSIGDRFILKSFEHVNDDGTVPEGDLQGKAKEGFTFELRAGKTQLFETKVK